MTAPIQEPTPPRQVAAVRYTGKDTRQKPLAARWITPINEGGTLDALEPTWTPELQNGWEQPSNPLEQFSFRKHYDGSLEFKGHLNASTSGTVAVTLPGIAGLAPNYTLDNDQFFHTTITTDDGTTFTLALVFIDSTTGDVTITWPAQ